MCLLDENFEVKGVCVDKIFVFKLSSNTDRITLLVLTLVTLELVLGCQEKQSLTCRLIPPIRSTLSLCGNVCKYLRWYKRIFG